MISNERKVISNGNRGKEGEEEREIFRWLRENKTGTGLAENEVTRRGNSPGIGSEKIQRGVERKGRGLEEKSRQIFVPAQYERRRVAEKNRQIKRNSPGDRGEILFETRGTLSCPIL